MLRQPSPVMASARNRFAKRPSGYVVTSISTARASRVSSLEPLAVPRCPMSTETTPTIDDTIADIRKALDELQGTRSWHIEKDAIRDANGVCIAWQPFAHGAHPAFGYMVSVRPEVIQSLLGELERLQKIGRLPAKRADPL
jgi:hypothetical protein